jgi:hypothetical protein
MSEQKGSVTMFSEIKKKNQSTLKLARASQTKNGLPALTFSSASTKAILCFFFNHCKRSTENHQV